MSDDCANRMNTLDTRPVFHPVGVEVNLLLNPRAMLRRAVPASLALLSALLTGCAQHGAPGNSAATTKPLASFAVARGHAIYAERCAACHGANGSGGQIGPSLIGERTRKTHAAILDAIEHPTPPMPKLEPAQMSAADVENVATFVEQL
jgi:mono/diheme cytochrome c family protein